MNSNKRKQKSNNTKRKTTEYRLIIVLIFLITILIVLCLVCFIIFMKKGSLLNDNKTNSINESILTQNTTFIEPYTNKTTDTIVTNSEINAETSSLNNEEPNTIQKVTINNLSIPYTGIINCYGEKIDGYSYSYICGQEKKIQKEQIDNGSAIIAYRFCCNYGINWYECYSYKNGEYYGWIDSNYIDYSEISITTANIITQAVTTYSPPTTQIITTTIPYEYTSKDIGQTYYEVGDTIETEKFKITYLSCGKYKYDYNTKPRDGYNILFFELEFENISNSDQVITQLAFNCFADNTSCGYSYRSTDHAVQTLVGKTAKGTFCFEVPKNAKNIEVQLASYLSPETAILKYKQE